MKDHHVFLKPWGEIRAQDWHDWKWQFKNRLLGLVPLAGVFGDFPSQMRELQTVTARYPFSVTPYYFSLINAPDQQDPLRRQCVPDLQEIQFSLGG
ncbi:MAG: hypothetical protein Q7I89_07415, partial [Syntrophales bacterium]|nr:hypothetical protein [Syntrophales bacterium]